MRIIGADSLIAIASVIASIAITDTAHAIAVLVAKVSAGFS